MPAQAIELECPGCASPISLDTKVCPYCHRPIVISDMDMISGFSPLDLNKQIFAYRKAASQNPDSRELAQSEAFCYLKLGRYDDAINSFTKALEGNFDNADTYLYAAVALLRGKRPFLSSRETINKIVEYINAANMIEPKGIYYYFLGFVKQDYFERKYLRNLPSSQECLAKASEFGFSDADVKTLNEMMGLQ